MCAFKRDSSSSGSRPTVAIACTVAALVPPVVLFAPRHLPDAVVGFAVGTLLGISALAVIKTRKA